MEPRLAPTLTTALTSVSASFFLSLFSSTEGEWELRNALAVNLPETPSRILLPVRFFLSRGPHSGRSLKPRSLWTGFRIGSANFVAVSYSACFCELSSYLIYMSLSNFLFLDNDVTPLPSLCSSFDRSSIAIPSYPPVTPHFLACILGFSFPESNINQNKISFPETPRNT